MKRFALLISALIITLNISAQDWKPAGEKLKTRWAGQVDPANTLPEYPRPQMVRDSWQNLNGLWDYAIQTRGGYIPQSWQGRILVPFAVESSLSGVQKTVGQENELWYHRTFSIPSAWKNKNILLHFGAVDWKADVWLNDIKIGTHQGGYTPFNFDITPFLAAGGTQKLVVRVWDPTDQGYQPRGKQVVKPGGIMYTAVTGIWQTVWMEAVGQASITHLKTVPDIDGQTVTVDAQTSGTSMADIIQVSVMVWRNGKVIDQVKSYFGMRKISTGRDENGVVRLQLNNKNYFQFGPLDQGWWPDGLYTAPTDEALLYDIKKTREFGFNMIRKHVKVEPARWYYHCDREGILVWQDMPSWRSLAAVAATQLFRRPGAGAECRIGTKLPPGMEGDHRSHRFQSECGGMGAVQ
jgi:hypothetical protein